MPELAEVEKVRELIERNALNKKITRVTAFEDEIIFVNKKAKEIESSLINSRVINVCRKGKIFWMELDSSPHISFHLGMTGRMIVRGENILTYYRYPDNNEQNEWPPRFCKLLLVFDSTTEIAFTNTRRFGRVRLHNNLPSTEEPICKLGYDPYNSMCCYNEFSKLILKRKCPLKAALLDQSFTAGVGNWICDEVCYQSGIYPAKYCNTLNNLQISRIYNSLQSIVKYAVSVHADYDKFPQNWLFHYRWNKGQSGNHSDAFGNNIIYQQIGGRTTAIVLKLQSKCNGYRTFQNSKKLGKIESYQQKLKMQKENKLIDDNTNNRKRKLDENVDDNTNHPPRKKRKISKVKSEKDSNSLTYDDYDPKTHILTSNNVLIPIGVLRRSSRLASKKAIMNNDVV